MSFEFGLKNILRNWKQSISYIVTIAILFAITVFFIYLGNGLGIVFFDSVPRFNITTVELFSQYFRFIIYSSMVVTLVWIVVINHSLIHHKTHDIAVIKAIGAIQRKLRSFFFAVVLLIDIIGIILGIICGFLLYLVFFFILSAVGFDIIIYIDFIFVPILIIGILIMVFLINGYELWKISMKNYASIALGDIPKNIDIQFKNFIPKNKLGARIKLALRNLTRKRKSFYRVLITSILTLSIIVTLTTSVFIISSTTIQSIRGAQGNNVIVMGHEDVVNHYIERYEEFSNSDLIFTNNDNLTSLEYLMNASVVDTLINSHSDKEISYWDKRVFAYEFAREMKGYIYKLENGEEIYQIVGSNRTAYVPVLGLEFQEIYTSQWQIVGDIGYDPNSALVGDTLAAQLFEAAIFQRIKLENITTQEYNVTGVFFDSFCAGFSTYVPLESLQQDLNISNQINLLIVGLSPTADKEAIIQSLQSSLNSSFGSDFVARDLTVAFRNNLKALYPFVIVSILVIIIETVVIIASLFYYQMGNFQERAPDYAIIKGIGGTSKFIKQVIFYEDFAILAIASSIALSISLIFNGVILYQDAILPPIWLIMLLWLALSVITILIVKLSIVLLYKELKRKQKIY
ncbi:MAG: ABC transporter permease [Candidatus Lokiarchaeota archaeon]|nr:ABC transporter permease [Candidatus Lokiarchaeota archaeon]